MYVYKRLSVKSFHEVWAGNAHGYSLKSSIGKVTTVRRRRLVAVAHRVVCGTLEAVNQVLAPCGWQINTAFVERLNLTSRQHVAAVGRRVSPLCKSEVG